MNISKQKEEEEEKLTRTTKSQKDHPKQAKLGPQRNGQWLNATN
jgi:hypothetical protein